MRQALLAPVAILLLTAPVSLVVFYIIPHATFVATFASGVLVGCAAMVIVGLQLIRMVKKSES